MTDVPLGRRDLLLTGALVLLAGCSTDAEPPRPASTPTPTPTPTPSATPDLGARIARLERRSGARIGVYADLPGGPLAHRPDERFAMCSTFKTVLAGAVLADAPRPGAAVGRDLAAAVSDSDNDAANRLLERVGGPRGVTRFVREAGDDVTRLDRIEPDLNTAVPGDPRDTTSPRAIAATYRELVLGDALPRAGRDLLADLLVRSTTGAERIRAGLPAGWQVGDKTGTGAYGNAHDVAVVWPPGGDAFVLAVYTAYDDPGAAPRDDLVAAVAREVVAATRP